MNYNLLFFTAATRRYKNFITPYCFFALYHNINAKAEIMIDGASEYMGRNAGAQRVLNQLFPDRILLREISRKLEPHTARFVCEPLTELQYTYINDVDILILESDLVETHTKIMREHKSIFSNRMRGTDKLTGVQFVITAPYYKVTEQARATTKLFDEHALYDIVNRGIGRPQNFTSDLRPVHGFHVSMNRPPVAPSGQAAWKLGPEPLREKYRAAIKSMEWK
jgi:hypothetical protein